MAALLKTCYTRKREKDYSSTEQMIVKDDLGKAEILSLHSVPGLQSAIHSLKSAKTVFRTDR